LSRTSAHRVALRRNLAQSLIEHETISTTIQKAKEVKPFVERLITLAKKGSLQHRRRAISILGNRNIVAIEDGEPVEKGTVIGKLFSELGPRYLDRQGGYTRIIRLPLKRRGDQGQLVLLQLLGKDEPLKKEEKKPAKRRSRRKPKEAVAASGAKAEETAAEAAPEPAAEPAGEPEQPAAGEAEQAPKGEEKPQTDEPGKETK
jgi:large subunit ribosomal protein L17